MPTGSSPHRGEQSPQRSGTKVQVVRPELTVYGESVKGTLQALIEKLRGRCPQEIFLPTA